MKKFTPLILCALLMFALAVPFAVPAYATAAETQIENIVLSVDYTPEGEFADLHTADWRVYVNGAFMDYMVIFFPGVAGIFIPYVSLDVPIVTLYIIADNATFGPFVFDLETVSGEFGGVYWHSWDGFLDLDTVESTPPSTPAPAPNLNTASDWAHEGISRAVAMGIVPAQLQNNYNQAITRAEFAALAVAFFELTLRNSEYPDGREITGRVTFDDTSDVNVEKAAYVGLVGGVGNNRFNPDGLLTREQAAVLISRLANHDSRPFFGWFNDVFEQEMPIFEPTFADNDTLSAWAIDGVGHMQAWDIMGGVGGNRFNPRGAYTREQSIVTFLRLADFLSVIEVPYGVTTLDGWIFADHAFLETVIIPSTVNFIGEHTFINVPTLRYVYIHAMDIYMQFWWFFPGWNVDFSHLGLNGITVFGYPDSDVEYWFSERDYYRENNFVLMD